MKLKQTLVAAAALSLALTACGGDGGGRPSQAEIKEALTSEADATDIDTSGLGDEVIDCLATAFHDSDLSDEALQAMVDGDEDYEGSEEDTEALAAVSEEAAKCATAAVE